MKRFKKAEDHSSTNNYLTERPEPEVDWSDVKKYTPLVGVGEELGKTATFLTISHHNGRIWLYLDEDDQTAYSFIMCNWRPTKPEAKETPTCQKA